MTMSLIILFNARSRIELSTYNTLEPLGWLLTFSFAFLWFRNRIMLIGLLVINLYANLRLWSVPWNDHYGPELPVGMMHALGPAVYLFALGCLIMAQWPQFYPWSLVRRVKIAVWKLMALVIGLAILMQYLGRS